MEYPAEATFYVRLSLMNPKPGNERRVSELIDKIIEYLPSQPGYIRGYKLVSGDPQGRIGRIAVYRSEQDADNAAQTQHILSIRSELLQLVEEGSHVERSYTAYDPQVAQSLAG
jgi:quinol monooxygenase YgiN